MESCNLVCNPIVPSCKLAKDQFRKGADSTTHKQMEQCLMYFLATRPDLAYSACLIARYMERPTEIHMAAVKRILRYLKGKTSYGLMMYKKGKREELMTKPLSLETFSRLRDKLGLWKLELLNRLVISSV